MLEQWKSLKDLVINGDNYEVSSLGNVRNKATEKQLKHIPLSSGYTRVYLYLNGKSKMYSIHRLVAIAFCKGYSEDLHVNHIDGNKTNNIASNLEWVTPSENQKHAYDNGLQDVINGEDIPWSLVTEDQVREIRQLYASGGYSYRKLASIYGIGYTTVRDIVKYRNWKHVD